MLELAILFSGIGLGWIVNYLLVVRPLVKSITHMRYVGFAGDPRPTPPTPPAYETVAER